MSEDGKKPFTFEISLSVLDHLGRNLYRSFATGLGEAISNSWDADAKSVRIYINKKKNSFFIKDDGDGMDADDFQNKFLKIGYSKRRTGKNTSTRGRPFIGRKGIGKLALLSCAEKITVISKTKGGDYVGGVIDNSGLNKAIKNDLTPDQYPLEEWKLKTFGSLTKGHSQGTIIYFENIKDGIKSSLDYLKKIVALYFRFSLMDDSFNIFIDEEKITHKNLKDLAEKTEFLWKIGECEDPYLKALEASFSKERNETKELSMKGVRGFIASVEKPMDLKITTTEERVGVDLFVNGRLRERDILKHIPTARIAENYLYGQIHVDALDDKVDRFTSSREGIIADDPKYQKFLEEFRKKILEVVGDWDAWRIRHRKEGDPENPKIPRKQRKSIDLYNAVSGDYELPKDSPNRQKVEGWVNELQGDAAFNFESYAECFISENLIRKFISEKKLTLSKEAVQEAEKWKKTEKDNKNKGNISIAIRRVVSDLSYLSMDHLANFVDKKDKIKEASLARDAGEYRPIRDAVAHTSLLTDAAKKKLTSVYENIKARVKKLLGTTK
jgi:hypothetical protein